MSSDQNQSLSDGITFQVMSPVDWHDIKALPIDNAHSQSSSANLRLLNALNILEEVPLEHEKSLQATSDINHLDAKLDLVLGMLGELLHQQAKIPETSLVTVSAHTVSIDELNMRELPKNGDLLRVRLFLDTRYPQALILYGTVLSTHTAGFSLEIYNMGDLVQEQLDKLIFRQHRRAIASSRSEVDT